jgi:hypothetical protein
VVIDYLNIMGVAPAPPEADSPPLVNPDAMLPPSVTRQPLKAIAWRNPQIGQLLGSIENQKLAACSPQNLTRDAPCWEPVEYSLRIPIPEAPNHTI